MKDKKLFACDWAIVDLETTGGDVLDDRITEIGIVFQDADGKQEQFSTLVNPGRPIPRFIQMLTGINDTMVADAPPFASLAESLLERLQGRLFIAHNARFDYNVLSNEFRRLGMAFSGDMLCSVKLSRRLFPQYPRHSLGQLIARHQLQVPQRHRALADADAVRQFIEVARQTLGDDSVTQAAQEILGGPVLFPHIVREQYDALPAAPGVLRFYDADDALLYLIACENLQRDALAYLSPKRVRNNKLTQQLAPLIYRVGFQETIGHLGAQLLALQEFETLQPRHRRQGQGTLYALRLFAMPNGMLHIQPATSCDGGPLYGLFRSQQDMKHAVLTICEQNRLCPQTFDTGRKRQVKHCRLNSGQPCYCRTSAEEASVLEHNQRLQSALEDVCRQHWPYAGPIAISESEPLDGRVVEHVFDNWCYLGRRYAGDEALQGRPMFSAALHKLLSAFLRQPDNGVLVHELTPSDITN